MGPRLIALARQSNDVYKALFCPYPLPTSTSRLEAKGQPLTIVTARLGAVTFALQRLSTRCATVSNRVVSGLGNVRAQRLPLAPPTSIRGGPISGSSKGYGRESVTAWEAEGRRGDCVAGVERSAARLPSGCRLGQRRPREGRMNGVASTGQSIHYKRRSRMSLSVARS
jgi:hypothetical protein